MLWIWKPVYREFISNLLSINRETMVIFQIQRNKDVHMSITVIRKTNYNLDWKPICFANGSKWIILTWAIHSIVQTIFLVLTLTQSCWKSFIYIELGKSSSDKYKYNGTNLIQVAGRTLFFYGFLSSVDIVNVRQITWNWLLLPGILRKVLEDHQAI